MGIDGNCVEHNLAAAALHVKNVEQIFYANIMGGKRWRIVARKTWRRPRNSPQRMSIGSGIDKHDVIRLLQWLEQRKAPRAAIQALYACWQHALLQSLHDMNTNALIAHQDVAQTQYQCLLQIICHS